MNQNFLLKQTSKIVSQHLIWNSWIFCLFDQRNGVPLFIVQMTSYRAVWWHSPREAIYNLILVFGLFCVYCTLYVHYIRCTFCIMHSICFVIYVLCTAYILCTISYWKLDVIFIVLFDISSHYNLCSCQCKLRQCLLDMVTCVLAIANNDHIFWQSQPFVGAITLLIADYLCSNALLMPLKNKTWQPRYAIKRTDCFPIIRSSRAMPKTAVFWADKQDLQQ